MAGRLDLLPKAKNIPTGKHRINATAGITYDVRNVENSIYAVVSTNDDRMHFWACRHEYSIYFCVSRKERSTHF